MTDRPRCNWCRIEEGMPVEPAEPGLPDVATLLRDFEEYDPSDLAMHSPGQLPSLCAVWCLNCAVLMDQQGDAIREFYEFGFEERPDLGPYRCYLAAHSAVTRISLPRRGEAA